MADVDRRLAAVSDTPTPPDAVETPAEDSLLDKMVRIPTEADFEDVLTPEGNRGGVFGSDVSDSTAVTNTSIAGGGLP